MSESSVERHIDAVDAYARTLFLRTRQNPDLYGLTDEVRQLHVALRHLRIEAADPDSLLSSHESLYAGQLKPLVDACANTLNLLEDALDDYEFDGYEEDDSGGSGGGGGGGGGVSLRTARSRLRGEKTRLDGFLDAVQLQKSKAVTRVDTDEVTLDRIQDKVDEVAKRVFNRRDSGFENDDEDRVWKEFKAELEKEGFSPTVLKKHKDVLRAYIRSLETMSSQTGGATPSVRGMLEYEVGARKTGRHASDKEVVLRPSMSPTLAAQTRAPGGEPPPIPPKEPLPELDSPPMRPTRPSVSPESPDGMESVDSMALILTKDIMDMDKGMANLHIHPDGQAQLPSSHDPKYLAWPSADPSELHNASPKQTWSSAGHGQGQWGLAPDSYGKEIPMNAQWTRINRDLISPEVLARAGVRYEARPAYVAILGRLSREQIADFARQSADCRAARAMRHNNPPLPPRPAAATATAADTPTAAATATGGTGDARQTYRRSRTDSKSSREDLDDDDESDLFDESDTTNSDDDGMGDRDDDKGTKSYPFIVSPPEKTSPSATAKPKSILKNRNENHVRFDPEPYEVSARSPTSGSSYRGGGSDERTGSDRRRRRDDDRDHRHHHHHHHHRSGSGDAGGDRHKSRSTYEDRDYHHRRHRGDRDRDRERDRGDRGDRDRERERERKSNKKKAWGETLGAVGLGGAAVSLLSVLAEAAT